MSSVFFIRIKEVFKRAKSFVFFMAVVYLGKLCCVNMIVKLI
jgi:hypothetical protein